MRKLILLTVLIVCFITVGKAQNGISGGILAGANLSTFTANNVPYYDQTGLIQQGTINFNDFCKVNFDGGGYINFPIGSIFSIEPQVFYSHRVYDSNVTNTDLSFVSVPVFLKFNLGDRFALMAGPQFDFLTHVKDDWGFTKDAFKDTSFGITAGFEVGIWQGLVFYGKYNWGLNDLFTYSGHEFQTPNPLTSPTAPQFNTDRDEFKNQSIHLGLKYKLFGGSKAKGESTVAAAEKDSDGDGIIDKEDKCPNVAGVAKYKGCPVPDTDGDGVNDEEDLCPKVAGIAGNYGCPEMTLYYEKADAELSAADKANLDKVVKFLDKNPTVNVSLEGHTSTEGAEDYNMNLSKRRVEMSVDYLVSKGISKSRLHTQAYGESRPAVEDSTEEGKVKNRRVEVKVVK